MMASTYTGMAVDTFRKQEQARRRLAKAEAATLEALRRVPRDEMGYWFEQTEAIRMAMDAQDEEEAARHAPHLVPLRTPRA